MAGRLGHLCYCPDCGYIVLEDVTKLHTYDEGRAQQHMPARLRCEKRGPELLKGTPPIMDGQGIIVPDPVGGFMGIAQCAKCDAKKRSAKGWDTMSPEFYEAHELDDEVS
jgi:hypothetical protein